MGPVSGNLWRTAHPRASVLVVHGLGEHGGRYAAFASELATWGFTTAAVDWPGHGRSPGPRGNASWSAMRDEIIPAALDALATEVPVPRLLVGHSMGGAMALDVALAHPTSVASVVACGPAVRTFPPQWWKLAAGRLLRVVAPHVGIPHGLSIDALSRDAEVVALYRADPLVQGSISAQLYFDVVDAQRRIIAGASSLSVPALLVAGTADRIIDWTGARDFAAAAPNGRARFVPLDGAFHEVLNDTGRDVVVRLILAFWQTQLQPS
jgi:acylglycerol lipase